MKKGLALVALCSLVVFAATAFAVDKFNAAEKAFIKDAASGGMMEVELGKMAQQQAANQAVKDFAKQMQTDHQAANDELTALAQKNNLQLPPQMERMHKSKVEKLSKLSGAKFDKTYMQAMVADHKKDIAKFKKASKTAKDPDLKGFVDKTLPTLEHHLEMARQIAPQVGAKVK
jgi:putative membrane protein